jgi:diguanylate cyclase
VVAEGIELPEQITSLRDLGCDLGQGFFFAKPMTHEALVEYLDKNQQTTDEARSHAA